MPTTHSWHKTAVACDQHCGVGEQFSQLTVARAVILHGGIRFRSSPFYRTN